MLDVYSRAGGSGEVVMTVENGETRERSIACAKVTALFHSFTVPSTAQFHVEGTVRGYKRSGRRYRYSAVLYTIPYSHACVCPS